MPELSFAIEGVEGERFAAAPTLLFQLAIAAGRPVKNILLRCQIRIEPARRGYDAGEPEKLRELFGERSRWGQTLRSFLWDHVTLPVPAFEDETKIALPLACSHDFNVAATKYCHGLEGGSVPLRFLFSGAVFYDGDDGRLQIGQVPLSKEASFALPVAAWANLIRRYYPDAAWLRVPHRTFERLYRYKREKGFADWESTLESLIPAHPSELSS